jgi:hypothetical protein
MSPWLRKDLPVKPLFVNSWALANLALSFYLTVNGVLSGSFRQETRIWETSHALRHHQQEHTWQ